MTAQNRAYPPSICPGIPRLGKCPRGWSTRTFGEMLRVVERPVAPDDDTEYQLVNAKRNRGGIVARERLKGREIKTKGQYLVHAGDFLLANRQIIHGGCGIVPTALEGSLVSGEYTVLQPRDGLFLPWFAAFTHTTYFQQACFQSSIGVDVEKMVLKLEWWKAHQFNVPPVAEQRKIVAILSTWDAALEQTRALIAAAKHRKTGLMQELLTGKRRLPGFAGKGIQDARCRTPAAALSDVGLRPESCVLRHDEPLPEGWTMRRLGDLGSVVSGGTPDTAIARYWNGTIPWITPGEVTLLNSPFVDRTLRSISEEGLEGSGATILPVGSLIVCTRATVGACAINSVPMTTNQGFKNLVVRKGSVYVAFLYYWMALHKHVLMRLASGSTFLEVSKSSFESITIICPSLPEQRAIAAVLTAADDEIRDLERQLLALDRQKKGLMQKLLTGDVRVRD